MTGPPLSFTQTMVGEQEVTRNQRRVAAGAAATLFMIALLATPFADVKLPVLPGFMPAFASAMIVINILLASLLYCRAASQRRADSTLLGTSYLFVALIFMPLLASFPGVVTPEPLFGSVLNPLWLWVIWHAGFGLLIISYALRADRPKSRVAVGSAALAVIAASATVTAFVYLLPPLSVRDGIPISGAFGTSVVWTVLGILGVALLLVSLMRRQTLERQWLAVGMVAAIVDVWISIQATDLHALGAMVAKCASLATSLTVLITLLWEITALHTRLATANGLLQELAHRDGLTGLWNRRHLDGVMEMEWRRSLRERYPIAVLMIDVDQFKKYNDLYGHPEGDECLRQVADVLAAFGRRAGDLVARYGGEEFTLLLPRADAAGVETLALQIGDEVRRLGIKHVASSRGVVTVSIGMGWAYADPATTVHSLVAAADRGLYRAKAQGRDRACWADGDQPAGVSQPLVMAGQALPSGGRSE